MKLADRLNKSSPKSGLENVDKPSPKKVKIRLKRPSAKVSDPRLAEVLEKEKAAVARISRERETDPTSASAARENRGGTSVERVREKGDGLEVAKKPKHGGPPPSRANDQVALQVTAEKRHSLRVLTQGQFDFQKALKARKLLPPKVCDRCYLAEDCPRFEVGAVCAFSEAFAAFPARDVDGVLESMRQIVEKNQERLQFAFLGEEIANAGQMSPDVTRLSETVLQQQKDLLELNQEVTKIGATVVGPGGKSAGLLARLFGGGNTEVEQEGLVLREADVIDPPNELVGDTKSEEAPVVVDDADGEWPIVEEPEEAEATPDLTPPEK